MSFIGYVTLEEDLAAAILMRDASRTPVNLDDLPTFRVYGPEGLLPGVTGSASLLDSGTITGVTNANPIVVTSVGHGLTTGTYITITGVLGTTAANGSFLITRLDDDTFELGGGVGNAPYLSGGTWNVAGLYRYTIAATGASGFEVGQAYTILIQGTLVGLATADTQVFIVV